MNGRGLKMALAVSVAVNVFAVASGVALWISRDQAEARISEAQKFSNRQPLSELVAPLPEARRNDILATMKHTALEARPDFEEARRTRREAIRLTEDAVTYDPIMVSALLEQSRASELRARARLETGAVTLLSSLDYEERKLLAPMLSRHNHRPSPEAGSVAKPSH